MMPLTMTLCGGCWQLKRQFDALIANTNGPNSWMKLVMVFGTGKCASPPRNVTALAALVLTRFATTQILTLQRPPSLCPSMSSPRNTLLPARTSKKSNDNTKPSAISPYNDCLAEAEQEAKDADDPNAAQKATKAIEVIIQSEHQQETYDCIK
jgi:hypothetical protein